MVRKGRPTVAGPWYDLVAGMGARDISAFEFKQGRILAGKYEVLEKLGGGYEGEVYKVRERGTGIERALKAFYPHRNENNQASIFYARKLHKLRNCPILIQYHTEETIQVRRRPVKLLVSDYIEGELLSAYLKRQRGHRLHHFVGLQLLYELARGVERIHAAGEYHGDLHTDNIILRRRGLSFDVKLIDFYFRPTTRAENRVDDLCDLVRLFYDSIGGKKHYGKQPPEVKAIIRGLRRTLILERFRTVRALRSHLETMEWA